MRGIRTGSPAERGVSVSIRATSRLRGAPSQGAEGRVTASQGGGLPTSHRSSVVWAAAHQRRSPGGCPAAGPAPDAPASATAAAVSAFMWTVSRVSAPLSSYLCCCGCSPTLVRTPGNLGQEVEHLQLPVWLWCPQVGT